jgi:hypothetical protein
VLHVSGVAATGEERELLARAFEAVRVEEGGEG